MPEPLGYARGALEELRARYEGLSREELLELVLTLTKEYVLDQTIPFDFPHPERADELRADRPDAPAEEDPSEAPELRFGRLIAGLKARTGLPQFAGFELEDGKAVLIVDNQKVVFGERVTVALFSRRGPRSPAPAPAQRPAPTRSPSPARPAPAAPPEPSRSLSLDDDPAPSRGEPHFDDSGVERFGGLDLD